MDCQNGEGPPMNTDISGIGVRVSFYLQTLFLSCLSARSGSLDEISGALYTLLATNTAMAVTALILGLKPSPEISFHDALVVFYLLYLSWVTVFFTLPACARFPGNVKMLHFASIIQSYTVFAFAFAMLITADTFGQYPKCNRNGVVVIFRPFSALKAGRTVAWIMTVLVATVYTGILVKDHMPPAPKLVHQWIQKRVTKQIPATDQDIPMTSPHVAPPQKRAPATAPGRVQYHSRKPPEMPMEYDLQIAWNLVIEIAVVLMLWGLTVMNTELLIRWNRFNPSGAQSSWQFGQVLPMFLTLLPFCNLVNAFRDFGLRPLPA
ncbi:hypothetical protein DFH07DRAFT_150502 [Mycena maculata]|uniref:Uncharacterized protein n=1 Tax=Mycena maculata TaxID=230809 RepID=A0AAD7MTW9_9AGAR|nr:hypothetical protein DFH07DRAFT_150502 [Mycena maculata]